MQGFIHRALEPKLKQAAGWYPVVSLTGPRQSGKSTLAKHAFPDYSYVTLEDPQIRAAAIEDPVSFIRNRPERLIIDEAQYAPGLFSMIQVVSDERGSAGQYVLTGSQSFLLMESISQSLAGRIGLTTLLPLSYRELQDSMRGNYAVDDFTFMGGYPRLHSADIPPAAYFPSYVETYIERDVAGLLDVRNKTSFRRLLEMCALNTGALLNYSSLANDADVAPRTAKSWLSILESSHIVFLLQPFHANARKRLTKSPKLYFYDTGLLCHLLHITSVEQLVNHEMFGAVFENLIISETAKQHLNNATHPELYFYRDDSKREIDLLDFTNPADRQAVEIKSSRTYHSKYARHLLGVGDELDIAQSRRFVVARVEDSYQTKECRVLSARDWLMGVR